MAGRKSSRVPLGIFGTRVITLRAAVEYSREVQTISGDWKAVEEEVDQLRKGMRGSLLGPEDPAYQEARVIFNGMFDPRPALIARCRGAADVADAVRFARRHSLLAAIRGGGHS